MIPVLLCCDASAFIGGTGDFVTLFEPVALQIEKQGYGHVVASIGQLGGEIAYTAYHAKSYIKDNPKVIEGFTKAIQKGLDLYIRKVMKKLQQHI